MSTWGICLSVVLLVCFYINFKMANRVIRDRIWSSDKLSECSIQAQLHYPRIYLLVDDWSCFEIDLAVIRGKVYPKMSKITTVMIEAFLAEYFNRGLLFRWKSSRTEYGYFTGSEEVRLPSPTRRHKRVTPVPPTFCTNLYQQTYNSLQDPTDELQDPTLACAGAIPIPSPNHKHNPNHILFNKFWKSYPRKQAKKKAIESWEKLRPDELLAEKIIKAVEKHKRSEQWKDSQMIPLPATYLNGERWEDEMTTTKQTTGFKPRESK